MNLTKSFALFLLFVALASNGLAIDLCPGTHFPEGVVSNLEKFPVHSGPLSHVEAAQLGLHEITLGTEWAGFNTYRRGRCAIANPELISVGTLVLADANNVPVYKASCGNRLVGFPPTCPKPKPCGVCNDGSVPNAKGLCANGTHAIYPGNVAVTGTGFLDRHPALASFLEGLGALVLWVLGVVVGLLALVFLLVWLAREAYWAWQRRRQQPPVIVPPQADRAGNNPQPPQAQQANPQNPNPPQGGGGAGTAPFVQFQQNEDGHQFEVRGHQGVHVEQHGDDHYTVHVRER